MTTTLETKAQHSATDLKSLATDVVARAMKGGATAAEILTLATTIMETVESRFGLRLEMEPVLVGF